MDFMKHLFKSNFRKVWDSIIDGCEMGIPIIIAGVSIALVLCAVVSAIVLPILYLIKWVFF